MSSGEASPEHCTIHWLFHSQLLHCISRAAVEKQGYWCWSCCKLSWPSGGQQLFYSIGEWKTKAVTGKLKIKFKLMNKTLEWPIEVCWMVSYSPYKPQGCLWVIVGVAFTLSQHATLSSNEKRINYRSRAGSIFWPCLLPLPQRRAS